MSNYSMSYGSNSWSFLDDFEDFDGDARCSYYNQHIYRRKLDWSDPEDRKILIDKWKQNTTADHRRCGKMKKLWFELRHDVLHTLSSIGFLREVYIESLKQYHYDNTGMYLVNMSSGQLISSILCDEDHYDILATECADKDKHAETVKYRTFQNDEYHYERDDYYKNKEVWLHALMRDEDYYDLPLRYIKCVEHEDCSVVEVRDQQDNIYWMFKKSDKGAAELLSKNILDLKDIEI